MVVLPVEAMSRERMERFIEEAATAADYVQGFGRGDCALKETRWWVASARQSTREQSENDRLADYLRICARLAKQYEVIVPREYILYDADSSEDLNRPRMIR